MGEPDRCPMCGKPSFGGKVHAYHIPGKSGGAYPSPTTQPHIRGESLGRWILRGLWVLVAAAVVGVILVGALQSGSPSGGGPDCDSLRAEADYWVSQPLTTENLQHADVAMHDYEDAGCGTYVLPSQR